MEEQWKDITGYEGYYQVSSYGQVRSLDRVNRTGLIRGRMLKVYKHCNPRKGEYKFRNRVTLCINGTIKDHPVHRLVAIHFLNNGKPTDLQVNHIDGDPQNNHIENLELVTLEENMVHACKTGIYDATKTTRIHPDTKEEVEYYSIGEAERQNGINYGLLRDFYKRGNNIVYRGYYWEFKNNRKEN